MVGPSSLISKLLLGLLIVLLVFYIYMDVQLYLRIQNYPLGRNYYCNTNTSTATERNEITYESEAWIRCEVNPLCCVTVKSLLLDHTDLYINSPLSSIFENVMGFSRSTFITPNMISCFHIVVSCVAGKLLSSNSLGRRRLGVVICLFSTFLDDLDGHVARAKKNIRGKTTDMRSTGNYVDAICDGLGGIALILGVFRYIKKNPPRRGYLRLPMVDNRVPDVSTKTKLKPATPKVEKTFIRVLGQVIINIIAWVRYVVVYQDMLERNDVSPLQISRQQIVFKSTWFLCVIWLRRIISTHTLLNCILLSIFCDKLREFLKAIQYSGYVILLVSIYITEMHLSETYNFIFNTSVGGSDNITSF